MNYKERAQDLVARKLAGTRYTDLIGGDKESVSELVAAIIALNAETIKSTEENWGGLPLCNPDELRRRFGTLS